MISSIANSQIKEIEKLQKKAKHRRKTGVFVVEGMKMLQEAGNRLERAYLSESYYQAFGASQLGGCDYELVADSLFKEISETMTPQGVLGLVRLPEYSLEELLAEKTVRLLLLEDIRDPGNLGTMLRTAEGAGFTGVVLSQESVDIFNPKVVRSTMGSIFRLPFVYAEDFYGTLQRLKQEEILLYGSHLKGAVGYDEEAYGERLGILVGNEAKGLTAQAASLSDRLVKIPMEGQVESLNAAVAATIIMYEIYRQRRRRK